MWAYVQMDRELYSKSAYIILDVHTLHKRYEFSTHANQVR